MADFRYLMVSADRSAGEAVRSVLQRFDAVGRMVETATAARAVLVQELVTVVLADVESLNGDGLDLIEWISQARPEVSVVAITPQQPPDLLAEVVRRGAHGVMVKPVTPEALDLEIRRTLARRRTAHEHARLKAFSPLAGLREILTGEPDYEQMLRRIVEAVGMELRADRASLVCLDEESGDIAVASVDATGSEARLTPAGGQSQYWRLTAAQVAALGEPDGYDEDRGWTLTIPLAASGSMVGVMSVSRDGGHSQFSASDRELLSLLASQSAIALLNTFLFRRIRQAYWNTIHALAHAAELRDHPIRGHSERLAACAVAVGRRLGLDRQTLDHLQIAALLHDVGKIGVSDVYLFKPGSLLPQEFEAVKRHSVIGAEILSAAHFPGPVVDMVRYHHERYDGNGYPAGLAGDAIPIGARILAVADAFEVMSSGRHYRSASDLGAIVAELRACSGSQFDPRVVSELVDALRDGDVIVSHPAAVQMPGTGYPDSVIRRGGILNA